MTLSVIVALAENGTIGREGTLPWRLPDDLRRFKRVTMGHTLIMGRKTFASIGRALPGRTTIVLTRQPDFVAPGAVVAHDLEAALALAANDSEPFIIGGGEIYRVALPRADRLYVTLVHAAVPGDAHFPPIDDADWEIMAEEPHAADERHAFPFTFRVLERRPSHTCRSRPMSQAAVTELLELSQKLLDVIAKGDWETYQLLCDPTLSAFEAEARGHLVEGLDFHEYYFALPRGNGPVQNTISCPRVRMLGNDAAVVTYVRLTQRLDGSGQPVTSRTEETRVWQRQDGVWRHVHFHRSSNS